MTNQHPITPPPELRLQWKQEWLDVRPSSINYAEWMLAKTGCWGYEQRAAVNEAELQKARDEELEGCGEWLKNQGYHPEVYRELRAARRPNPERSAKVALNLLDDISDRLDAAHENGIRRALERLQELEKDVPEPPTSIVFEGKPYTRADLVSPEERDETKRVVIGGSVEYFPSN